MRSALFIAYHYPPMRSAGVERSAKFARYLPDFGYHVTALSTTAFGSRDDATTLRAWEPLTLYRKAFNRGAGTGDVGVAGRRGSGFAARAIRYLRRHMLVPDAQITWIPFAKRHALAWLANHDATVIYSSSPPASTHLLAMQLKRKTGLPWVADFRDAWVYDPLDPAIAQQPGRLRRERRMERAVVEAADAVIAATEISADYLRRTYRRAATAISVIPNGFDPADIAGAGTTESPARDYMHIVHTGSFGYSHPDRNPYTILAALQKLIEDDGAWAQCIRLTLVGHLTPDETAAAADLVNAGVVQLTGVVERPAALALQRSADVLLLVDHARPWPASNVPGKFYEYIAMRTPVLALCGEGMVRRLMGELDAGVCVDADDASTAGDTIATLYREWEKGTLSSNVTPDAIRSFERRALAEQLAQCFDDVIARSGAQEKPA